MFNVNKREGERVTSLADGIKYAVKSLSSIKLLTAFRVTLFLMVLVLVIFSANVAMNKNAVEKLVEHVLEQSKEEKRDLDIRDMVSPKIQRNLLHMVYELNCDRAFVIELHNGKKNATELPFKFYDMTYEEVNDNRNVKHISQYFINTMVTHYKLPYYLSRKTYFFGTANELSEIDSRFAANFEEHDGKYLGIMILRSNREEIGFLGIAYNDTSCMKSHDVIKKELEKKANVIKDLLDLGIQRVTISYDKDGNIINN